MATRHTNKYLRKVTTFWDENPFGYEPELKNMGHDAMKRILRDLAANIMNLRPDQFVVRSNLGGIAVSGEVTLHTDAFFLDNTRGLYVQVYQDFSSGSPEILWRSCKGRTDYTGDTNHFSLCVEYLSSRDKMRAFWNKMAIILQQEHRTRIR